MKYGKKRPAVKITAHIHPNQYERAHRVDDCDASWSFAVRGPVTITLNSLGPIPVAAAAFVTCDKCKATYFAPGYQDFVEKVVAQSLILSGELLSKKQLRFLRMYFDLTQDDLAKRIGVTDRHELSKMESEGTSKNMSPDKQFRLKVFYAKLMKTDPKSVYEFLEINEDKFCELQTEKLFTKNDIEDLIKKTA